MSELAKGIATMAYPFSISNDTMLEAVEKVLETTGYKVEKLGRKIWDITKGNQTQKIAIRTSRDRYIGSPATGGALRRPDIGAFAIGAVNSRDNPEAVEVYLIPRAEILRRFEAHRAAGYSGRGPSFIALDKENGTIGVGSGLAAEFPPIAKIKLGGESAYQPVSASAPDSDVEVIDGIGRLKRDVVESAAKWLRLDPALVKIDIHITIDT
jgi:hypothetical protein